MEVKLPEYGRPLAFRYRKCGLGVDLPSKFVHDLWGIDQNLYPIFHPYRILWDDVVNEWVGRLNDPRYSVFENSCKAGELVMGHILTDGVDRPVEDGQWHIWRYCAPVNAWAHIINLDSTEPEYLRLLVKRIRLQAEYNDRYGHRGYRKMMEEADIARREKLQEEKRDLMNEIHTANAAMTRRAMDNLSRKITKPSNPQKEIITSYRGQGNRSKIVRPLTDREGGLILPDDLGR